MSLDITIDSHPKGITTEAREGGLHIYKTSAGLYLIIGMQDFCELVKYVLTNTDLLPADDPRLALVQELGAANIRTGEGWNPGRTRLHIVSPKPYRGEE